MKNFKQIIFLSIAGMFPLGVSAQKEDVSIFVNPDKIYVDGDKAKVEIWYESELDKLNAFDFELHLPEGFTIEKNSRGNFKFTINPDEDAVFDHSITAGDRFENPEDPFYKFVGVSITNSYLGVGRNMIFWFNLIVPETFTKEAYPQGVECHLSNMTIANDVIDDTGFPTGYHPADFNFTIYPKDFETGVDKITVDGTDNAIYDLNGMRVYPPLAPGIYISDGKKLLVK